MKFTGSTVVTPPWQSNKKAPTDVIPPWHEHGTAPSAHKTFRPKYHPSRHTKHLQSHDKPTYNKASDRCRQIVAPPVVEAIAEELTLEELRQEVKYLISSQKRDADERLARELQLHTGAASASASQSSASDSGGACKRCGRNFGVDVKRLSASIVLDLECNDCRSLLKWCTVGYDATDKKSFGDKHLAHMKSEAKARKAWVEEQLLPHMKRDPEPFPVYSKLGAMLRDDDILLKPLAEAFEPSFQPREESDYENTVDFGEGQTMSFDPSFRPREESEYENTVDLGEGQMMPIVKKYVWSVYCTTFTKYADRFATICPRIIRKPWAARRCQGCGGIHWRPT